MSITTTMKLGFWTAVTIKLAATITMAVVLNSCGKDDAPGLAAVTTAIDPNTTDNRGAKGDQGEKGEKGDKGETGSTGTKGDTGAQGTAGNNAPVNTYTDANGKDWIFFEVVQKSNFFAGKICPTGFSVATKAQVLYVSTQTDMIVDEMIANNTNGFSIWTAEVGIETIGRASSSDTVGYSAASIAPASVPASFPNAKAGLCVK